jgi:hypothetical protein
MLTPRRAPRVMPSSAAGPVSFRVSPAQAHQLAWLGAHLKMTRTQVLQALIEQEYAAQNVAGPVPSDLAGPATTTGADMDRWIRGYLAAGEPPAVIAAEMGVPLARITSLQPKEKP